MENLSVINKVEYKSNRLNFEWYMTKWCNYQCDYCTTINHKNFKLKSTEEYIKDAKKIANKLDRKLKYACTLKGGEITFLDLNLILEPLKNYDIKYYITTNLSNKFEYYRDLLKNKKIKIIASFHYLCNKDEFIYKVNELSKLYKIDVSFVIGESTIDYYSKVIDEIINLHNNNIKIIILPMKTHININNISIVEDFLKEKFDFLKKKINSTVQLNNKVFINDEPSNLESLLQIPVYFKNFDPYGYKCTSKYLFKYYIDKFIYHKCNKSGTTYTTICKNHKCNYCEVSKLEK